jgi:predicted RNA-binding protein with PUA domain
MEECVNTYKSPRRKLVRFFEDSRDKWKTKCQVTKKLAKRLKNRIRFLERTKTLSQKQASVLEAKLVEANARERAKEEEIETLKKNLSARRMTHTG